MIESRDDYRVEVEHSDTRPEAICSRAQLHNFPVNSATWAASRCGNYRGDQKWSNHHTYNKTPEHRKALPYIDTLPRKQCRLVASRSPREWSFVAAGASILKQGPTCGNAWMQGNAREHGQDNSLGMTWRTDANLVHLPRSLVSIAQFLLRQHRERRCVCVVIFGSRHRLTGVLDDGLLHDPDVQRQSSVMKEAYFK